jgi:hypothetical protein
MCSPTFYGVKRATFDYRFKKTKWTLEESLGLAKRDVKRKTVTVQGEDFPSLSAVARHFRIQLGTFNGRLNRGWTLEEACSLKPRTQVQAKRKAYVITHPDGSEETVANMAEFGRIHNLKTPYNLTHTIKSSKHHFYKGFSAREATEEEIAALLKKDPTIFAARTNYQRNHEVKYNGVIYCSKNNLCERVGIKNSMFLRQINKGASIEEAVKYCLNKIGAT